MDITNSTVGTTGITPVETEVTKSGTQESHDSGRGRFKKLFVSSVFAGLCIGLGGTVYLSVDNAVIGAFLFSLGLLSVLTFGFDLYTGKVGYILRRGMVHTYDLTIMWAGNIVGTLAAALIVRYSRLADNLRPRVEAMVSAKLNDNMRSVFLLSVACGVCMYIAVRAYRVTEGTQRVIMTILPVMVFILAGFEHSVADSFYFWLYVCYGQGSARLIAYLYLIGTGNAVGAVLIAGADKYIRKEEVNGKNN
nr:MAG TPA: Formate/nitrite transporter [Caudoviricetes sp.]